MRRSRRRSVAGGVSQPLRVVRSQSNPSRHPPLYQCFTEHYEQDFTAEPDRVAVDEKQTQVENEQKVWLYAAIDVDSKVVLHARLSQNRGTGPTTAFLRELKEKHHVSDAEFLVDGIGYLTALAKTDLLGDLNCSERNIVEKLLQTYTMRVERFHETWNGGQSSAERWLTAYTAYYNHNLNSALHVEVGA